VPDEYETIQAAINASTDGDTVRVRAGLYEEGVRIAKPLWLESESGPEVTIIDATGHGFGCFWAGIRDTVSSAIRGFTIRNCGLDGIFLGEGASVRVLNNVISQCDRAGIYIYDGMVYAAIVNNIIVDSYDGLNLYITTANISNNIIFNIETFAIWNSFTYDNPVIPDYNMFWSYQELSNNPPIHLGGNNILDQEPLFEEGSFRLQPGSPGINQGNPALNDTDGTRSDIGVYGGPNAYR
jgi:parallel beta-helix repeat protein